MNFQEIITQRAQHADEIATMLHGLGYADAAREVERYARATRMISEREPKRECVTARTWGPEIPAMPRVSESVYEINHDTGWGGP